MEITNYIYMFFSAIFVLFLPGFVISYVFFDPKKIDLIERIALSFALSISTTPLVTFYTNLIGIPIKKETIVAEILMIICAALLIILVKKYRIERRK